MTSEKLDDLLDLAVATEADIAAASGHLHEVESSYATVDHHATVDHADHNADHNVNHVSPAEPTEDKHASTVRVINQPDDLSITRIQLDRMISHIKDLMEGRRLTPSMLLRLTANCMLLASKMNSSSRISKKLVILSLEEYIRSSEAGLDDDEVNALMTMFDVVVDTAFDELYAARKGACCVTM